MQHATVHNFADDNTLSSFAKTFDKLKEILESESKCAIEWFTRNGTFANPDKFKAFVIDKKRINYTNERCKLTRKILDYPLNVNKYISNICKFAALNALVRLKIFLGSNERKVLVKSFVLSHFNYCPLVWFVSSSTSLRKIANLDSRTMCEKSPNTEFFLVRIWTLFTQWSTQFLTKRLHLLLWTIIVKIQ